MRRILFVMLVGLFAGMAQIAYCAEKELGPDDVPRMTIAQLKTQLNSPDVVILDVRSVHDWEDSKFMIKGARRAEPQKLGTWMNKYPKEKTVVLYCR